MVDLPSPGDVKAAVDENALAGNEARLLRAQPDCHIAHIIGLAPSLQRRMRPERGTAMCSAPMRR